MASALLDDGIIHLKSFFPTAMISALRERAIVLYDERDGAASRGELSGEQARLHQRMSLPLLDVDPMAEANIARPLSALAKEYLGHDPSLLGNSYIRTVVRGGISLAYHQDQTIVGQPLVNVWLPLQDCGTTSPSLELVAGSHVSPLPTIDRGENAVERATIDPATLSDFPAEAFRALQCNVGDVVIFTGLTVHRSHVTESMINPRISIELRLI